MLSGFSWEDYTCINPLSGGQSGEELKSELRDKKCALFKFLAIYKVEGLSTENDGILGLSPKKDGTQEQYHYLHAMKESGIIDNAMVSFSVTTSQIEGHKPYALFGGFNAT